MSDLKDRVGVATGGNANLLVNPGDLITGDGEQCVYLRNPNVGGALDGQVLTLDSTAEEGVSWQAGGGGGGGITNVTGADGITVTTPGLGLRQVHNSLVTGDAVAGMDAHVTGAGNGAVITTIDGDISISADGAATANGDLTLAADTATGTVDINGGTTTVRGANAVNVSPANGANVTVTTGTTGDLVANINHDETHTVGRNFALTAAGAGGASISTTHATAGNITLQTVSGDIRLSAADASAITIEQTGAGDINLSTASGNQIATMNGSIELTALGDEIIFISNVDVSIQPGNASFKIFGGVGAAQHAAIIDAAGGAVQDAECRTATNTILAALRAWGFVHT